MGDGHTLHVYGPHHAAPVDEYQGGSNTLLERGVVPGSGTDQHEWVHTQHGEPVNRGEAPSANEAMAAAEKSHADLTGGWDPSEILGRAYPRRAVRKGAPFAGYEDFDDCTSENSDKGDPDAYCGEIKHRTEDKKTSRRHQAWSGWGPALELEGPSAHHKVAGWEWDDHLNAHVSTSNPRTFTCSCGVEHPVPSYANCKCGKIWNSYVIGTGGDRHEASVEKFLAREIPQRKDVIVANRQFMAKSEPFDPRIYLAAQRESAINPEDLQFPKRSGYDLSNEAENSEPFPSEHHPKAGEATMNAQPDDWYARGKGNKWVPGVAGPHQFKKKRTDS